MVARAVGNYAVDSIYAANNMINETLIFPALDIVASAAASTDYVLDSIFRNAPEERQFASASMTPMMPLDDVVFAGIGMLQKMPKAVKAITSGLPKGITFESTIHRAVNPKYVDSAWDIHAGNISACHRYSDVGRGALYSGTSKKAVLGELKHYGIDPKDVAFTSKQVKVNNVLDLTNPGVRKQLGEFWGNSGDSIHNYGNMRIYWNDRNIISNLLVI